MNAYKLLNKSLLVFLFCVIVACINGCSPKIQQAGLRAPANIKIDGQTSEWPNNKLQAYNSDNRIEYTICNDDDNLYLTVRTAGHNALDKIMYNGLIFNINHIEDAKKQDTSNVTVTFPIVSAKDGYDITAKATHYNIQRFRNDSVSRVSRSTLDSLLHAANKKAAEIEKELKITGVKEIKDSLISVNNTMGIKAMGQFNKKMEYIYELAVPLKYLGLSIKKASKFSYSITLNSVLLDIETNSNGEKTYSVRKGRNVPKGMDINPDRRYMITTTKLNGEYTLARSLKYNSVSDSF